MNFGDVVTIDFGIPVGSIAGFRRPAVVVMADSFLRLRPSTVLVVPLTSTRRAFPSHVEIAADPSNGLQRTSWALVEQLRAVAVERCGVAVGNIEPAACHQLLDLLRMITGMP